MDLYLEFVLGYYIKYTGSKTYINLGRW